VKHGNERVIEEGRFFIFFLISHHLCFTILFLLFILCIYRDHMHKIRTLTDFNYYEESKDKGFFIDLIFDLPISIYHLISSLNFYLIYQLIFLSSQNVSFLHNNHHNKGSGVREKSKQLMELLNSNDDIRQQRSDAKVRDKILDGIRCCER